MPMRTSGNGSARGQGWGRTALRSATQSHPVPFFTR